MLVGQCGNTCVVVSGIWLAVNCANKAGPGSAGEVAGTQKKEASEGIYLHVPEPHRTSLLSQLQERKHGATAENISPPGHYRTRAICIDLIRVFYPERTGL